MCTGWGSRLKVPLSSRVLPENAEGREPKSIGLAYRRVDDPEDFFVVDVVQYDPVATPDLEKPLPDWTFVQEVQTGEHNDVIYRGGSAGGFWFYVAQRGSTEINIAGYTTAGRLDPEQLTAIARLLTPVGESDEPESLRWSSVLDKGDARGAERPC